MDDPSRCPRCLYRVDRGCLCAMIATVGPVATRTRVVILRHYSERHRASNSGRLAHLALPNSEVIEVGAPERHEVTPVLEAGAWLVYPDGPPRRASPVPAPTTLVFLDATWQQARRMRRRLGYLRGVPTLALAPVPMADRLRAAPAAGMVSTIEAIATALRLVEGDGVAEPLERLFAYAVARTRETGKRSVPSAG